MTNAWDERLSSEGLAQVIARARTCMTDCSVVEQFAEASYIVSRIAIGLGTPSDNLAVPPINATTQLSAPMTLRCLISPPPPETEGHDFTTDWRLVDD